MGRRKKQKPRATTVARKKRDADGYDSDDSLQTNMEDWDQGTPGSVGRVRRGFSDLGGRWEAKRAGCESFGWIRAVNKFCVAFAVVGRRVCVRC